MVLFGGAFGLLMLAVWIFCIVDVVTTPAASVRNLPKLVWALIVIVGVDIGSIAWLIGGRNWNERVSDRVQAFSGAPGTKPAPARRTRPVATNPDDDEEFLASLRTRVEEQRRRAREAQQDDPPAD